MLAQERRNLILEKLMNDKKIIVSEMSKEYKVSEETIRRDLEKLADKGFATKTYGGAILNENVGLDMPLNIRSKKNVAAKQTMALLAASMIHDGDHIMLDASSTALFIAKEIKDKQNLTVITNSLEIMLELSDVSGWTVVSSGGDLKEGYIALVGPAARRSLAAYCVDKSFLSCKALHRQRGVMESVEDIADIKCAMIEAAEKRYLIADHSKFDRTAFSRVGNLELADVLITDQKPSDDWLEYLSAAQVECIYPDK